MMDDKTRERIKEYLPHPPDLELKEQEAGRPIVTVTAIVRAYNPDD